MIITNNFSDLTQEQVNGLVDEVFNEVTARRLAEDKYRMIFWVAQWTGQAYAKSNIATFGWMQKVAEWSDAPQSSTSQGYKKVTTQNRYMDSAIITKDMRIFSDRHPEIAVVTTNLVAGAHDRIDQSYADMVNNATSTSYTNVFGETEDNTTADWVALASNSHKVASQSTTYGNIIYSSWIVWTGTPNPVLTRESIIAARIQWYTFVDSTGRKSPRKFTKLVVSPSDYDLAIRLTKTDNIPWSANNDTNMTLKDLQVVMWERLDAWVWFLTNEDIKSEVKGIFKQMPQVYPPFEYAASKNWIYTLDCYYSLFRWDVANLFISLGTWV